MITATKRPLSCWSSRCPLRGLSRRPRDSRLEAYKIDQLSQLVPQPGGASPAPPGFEWMALCTSTKHLSLHSGNRVWHSSLQHVLGAGPSLPPTSHFDRGAAHAGGDAAHRRRSDQPGGSSQRSAARRALYDSPATKGSRVHLLRACASVSVRAYSHVCARALPILCCVSPCA